MGVCLGDPDGSDWEARVLDLYSAYKQRRFCSSTPTLFNAGTPHPQLSSCFVYKVEDTLTSIVGRGIAGERDVLEVGRWPRRLVGPRCAARAR